MAQARFKNKGENASVSRKNREEKLSEFQIFLYILYILTSLSAENREILYNRGRLFLPNHILAYSLLKGNFKKAEASVFFIN